MKSPKISMKISFHVSTPQSIYLTGCGSVVLDVLDYCEAVVFKGVELFEGKTVEGPVEGGFGGEG